MPDTGPDETSRRSETGAESGSAELGPPQQATGVVDAPRPLATEQPGTEQPALDAPRSLKSRRGPSDILFWLGTHSTGVIVLAIMTAVGLFLLLRGWDAVKVGDG